MAKGASATAGLPPGTPWVLGWPVPAFGLGRPQYLPGTGPVGYCVGLRFVFFNLLALASVFMFFKTVVPVAHTLQPSKDDDWSPDQRGTQTEGVRCTRPVRHIGIRVSCM